MCKRHWFMVPVRLRRAVWAHYRAGQCGDRRPSRAWLRAADAAIGYVANAEGLPYRNIEHDALNDSGYTSEALQRLRGIYRLEAGRPAR